MFFLSGFLKKRSVQGLFGGGHAVRSVPSFGLLPPGVRPLPCVGCSSFLPTSHVPLSPCLPLHRTCVLGLPPLLHPGPSSSSGFLCSPSEKALFFDGSEDGPVFPRVLVPQTSVSSLETSCQACLLPSCLSGTCGQRPLNPTWLVSAPQTRDTLGGLADSRFKSQAMDRLAIFHDRVEAG